MDILREKTLIMLVAPSAMGKSTIMNEVIALHPSFSRVRSFTTRKPRPNDEPGHYFYLTQDELAAKRANGTIVTELLFPTTNETYGTIAESYPGTMCLLDTLANSVEQYRHLPFTATRTIAVTAPAHLWQKWFRDRYPADSDEARKRLDEALLSIDWCLRDTNTTWLTNDATPRVAAEQIIDVCLNKAQLPKTSPHPADIVAAIRAGIYE